MVRVVALIGRFRFTGGTFCTIFMLSAGRKELRRDSLQAADGGRNVFFFPAACLVLQKLGAAGGFLFFVVSTPCFDTETSTVLILM